MEKILVTLTLQDVLLMNMKTLVKNFPFLDLLLIGFGLKEQIFAKESFRRFGKSGLSSRFRSDI